MRNSPYFMSLTFAALLGGIITLSGYFWLFQEKHTQSIEQRQNMYFAHYLKDSSVIVPKGLYFVTAANQVRQAVVHIKISLAKKNTHYHDDTELLEDMFRQYHHDELYKKSQSSGSGVIITDNGYIVTNHHVIKHATKIEVVLEDKRIFKAKLIGTDPSTDLALLKIDAQNLPFIQYGDSDKLQIGEWVLAVGNPFELTSTVTAGIVSAKGRNIDLLKDEYAIESFIQTDAAVNPGNSGGALVNLKGELVGVNTAIATHTGFYSGYSFAVPVKIVKKVINDLMNYGESQRGILGVSIYEVDADYAQEKKLNKIEGVYIRLIYPKSSAELAGLQAGDIITSINENSINTPSDLKSIIALYSPGDRIQITFQRKGIQRKAQVVLKNRYGNVNIVQRKKNVEQINILEAEFSEITNEEKRRLGIDHGVKVQLTGNGKIKKSGIRDGFIIMRIESKIVKSPREVEKAIQEAQKKRKTIAIDGVYPNGSKNYYAIGGW